MKTRNIYLSGFHTVISESVISDLPGIISGNAGIVVCDEHTRRLVPLPEDAAVCLMSGEAYKTWESVDRILAACVERGLDRDSMIFGLGGGVVCDLAAFAASLYKRGCGLSLVPSTLLCMVDAGLGGKTGIDYRGYKNLVGTFYPAAAIYICTGLLETLPPRELLNGVVETLKHGMIGDPRLIAYLERHKDAVIAGERSVIDGLVWPSMEVKLSIVEEDLYEKGSRAYLNLGHTFGHALESVAGFGKVSHGEAVAWGIIKALDAGVLLGLCGEGYRERIRGLLADYGVLGSYDTDPKALFDAMRQDKKRRGGRHRLVLPIGEGGVTIREVTDAELIAVLEKL